jgi:hypothetical protein
MNNSLHLPQKMGFRDTPNLIKCHKGCSLHIVCLRLRFWGRTRGPLSHGCWYRLERELIREDESIEDSRVLGALEQIGEIHAIATMIKPTGIRTVLGWCTINYKQRQCTPEPTFANLH